MERPIQTRKKKSFWCRNSAPWISKRTSIANHKIFRWNVFENFAQKMATERCIGGIWISPNSQLHRLVSGLKCFDAQRFHMLKICWTPRYGISQIPCRPVPLIGVSAYPRLRSCYVANKQLVPIHIKTTESLTTMTKKYKLMRFLYNFRFTSSRFFQRQDFWAFENLWAGMIQATRFIRLLSGTFDLLCLPTSLESEWKTLENKAACRRKRADNCWARVIFIESLPAKLINWLG